MTSSANTRADLAALARPSGGFAILALDQREALRAMLAEHAEGRPVSDEQVTRFKLRTAELLTPYASGVLLDKQFVLDRAVAEGVIAPSCGLIAAADHFVPDARELVAESTIDPAVDPAAAAAQGAKALKLLVIWRPDGDPSGRVALVESFVRRAHGAGLLAIVEPVTRAPRDGRTWDREAAILTAAHELGSLGADLYKAEVPLYGRGSETETHQRCAALTDLVDSPWVVLSSGVEPDDFPRAVELACRGGASGFLAGRAIWRATLGASDLDTALRDDAIPRLQRLSAIVDRAVAGRND